MFLSLSLSLSHTLLSPPDPERVIDVAKKELEREREQLMSRSLPGFTAAAGDALSMNNQSFDNDESDSNSESESEDNDGEMQAELNDLSSDIELKTKLIEQLELSHQRMQIMRQHYEEKLNVLNSKIVNTQRERDQVLSNLSNNGNGIAGVAGGPGANDKMKKVRDEYERKLSDMQKELRKLQYAQKEHMRQQRELQAQDNQLRGLKNELYELKSAKVNIHIILSLNKF